jgi:hypothetical protein
VARELKDWSRSTRFQRRSKTSTRASLSARVTNRDNRSLTPLGMLNGRGHLPVTPRGLYLDCGGAAGLTVATCRLCAVSHYHVAPCVRPIDCDRHDQCLEPLVHRCKGGSPGRPCKGRMTKRTQGICGTTFPTRSRKEKLPALPRRKRWLITVWVLVQVNRGHPAAGPAHR